VVAAVAVAAALSCRPEAGLGSVSLTRGTHVEVVDLATCSRRTGPAPSAAPPGIASPDGRSVAAIRVVHAANAHVGSQAITVRDRASGRTRDVYRVRESYARVPAGEPGRLGLVGWSPDGRWLLFYLDPMGSASIAADGLQLEVVSARGGKPIPIAGMLMYPDYLDWCGGNLILTGGGDRIATTNKRLLVASPPAWRARTLESAPVRAWGALTCAPDGHSLVVQSQAASVDANFFHTHWSLWRIGLDGTRNRLTTPPSGYADESPQFSRDGKTILFVRSRNGIGSLYALRDGTLLGPLLSLGYQLGYFGHEDWWQTAAWSLAAR